MESLVFGEAMGCPFSVVLLAVGAVEVFSFGKEGVVYFSKAVGCRGCARVTTAITVAGFRFCVKG